MWTGPSGHSRAEAIAARSPGPSGRARARRVWRRRWPEVGDVDQARQVVQRAEAIAVSIAVPDRQAQALAGMAKALAESVMSTGPSGRSAGRGHHRLHHRHVQAGTVTYCSGGGSDEDGDIDRARQIIRQAEALVRSSTSIGFAWNLVIVAEALAKTGDVDGAGAITASLTNPIEREWALTRTAKGAAQAGEVDWAEAAARSITNPDMQAQALTCIAQTLANVKNNFYTTRNAVNGTNLAVVDAAAIQITKIPDGKRLEQLLSSALIQTRSPLTLLPSLARIEPAVVIKVIQNISLLDPSASRLGSKIVNELLHQQLTSTAVRLVHTEEITGRVHLVIDR